MDSCDEGSEAPPDAVGLIIASPFSLLSGRLAPECRLLQDLGTAISAVLLHSLLTMEVF